MKRLLSVATMSALLAVGAYASTTAFAANAHASPSATTVIETPDNEAADPVEAPGTGSVTESVETGTAADPAEAAGDTGHADNPADPNANHEFDGTE